MVDALKIYLIGSLRNREIVLLANELRQRGHEVFDDWISPGEDTDTKWMEYEKARGRSYREALQGYHAQHVFALDKKHLDEADVGVLVMPAGKSGHLELGYLVGQGKPAYVFFDGEPDRYDIMYLLATDFFFDRNKLLDNF